MLLIGLSPMISRNISRNRALKRRRKRTKYFINRRRRARFLTSSTIITLFDLFGRLRMILRLLLDSRYSTLSSYRRLIINIILPVYTQLARGLRYLRDLYVNGIKSCTRVGVITLLVRTSCHVLERITSILGLVLLTTLLRIDSDLFSKRNMKLSKGVFLNGLLRFLFSNSWVLINRLSLTRVCIVMRTIINYKTMNGLDLKRGALGYLDRGIYYQIARSIGFFLYKTLYGCAIDVGCFRFILSLLW